MRPTFYGYSFVISHILDFLTLLHLFFICFAGNHKVKGRFHIILITILFLFFLNALLTYYINSHFYNLIFRDFFEFYRFAHIAISILFGLYLSKYVSIFIFKRILAFLLVTHSIIGVLQACVGSDFVFLYKLFCSNNLLAQNRSGGVCYNHIEYSLYIYIILYFLIILSKRKSLFTSILVCLFLFLSCLSFSKSTFLVMFTFLLMNFVLKLNILVIIFCISSMLLLSCTPYFENFYKGLLDIGNLTNTTNRSFTNRLEDLNIVLDIIRSYDYRSLIGSSPLRSYDYSYIEITFLSVFFRFGLLGILFYYSIILFPLFKLFHLKIIDFKYIFMFIPALFIGDFTSNSSECLKLSSLYFITVSFLIHKNSFFQKLRSSAF